MMPVDCSTFPLFFFSCVWQKKDEEEELFV